MGKENNSFLVARSMFTWIYVMAMFLLHHNLKIKVNLKTDLNGVFVFTEYFDT